MAIKEIKESSALSVLAKHQPRSKDLPEMLPFPFKPDDTRGVSRLKRAEGSATLPKPSKFTPGTMYHSDYESDWEGYIRPKWRAYDSDNEHDASYRRYA